MEQVAALCMSHQSDDITSTPYPIIAIILVGFIQVLFNQSYGL